jgi:transcriptional regulator with XRE-family HTH domain
MARKRLKFSDEIRQAVESSGLSRYAICKKLGIDQAQLSRFMAGKGWIGQDNLDALAELLELHVAAGKPRRKK